MKELSSLKTLAEGKFVKPGTQSSVDLFFSKLQDEVEDAYEGIKTIRATLQSRVLTDMIKSLGHPATESKSAKEDAETAWNAIRSLEEEINDLHMALSISMSDKEGT